jgi:ABC-2 type transport system ATP-binding protein
VVVIAEGQLISEFGVSELAGAQAVLARAKDLTALAAAVERAGGKAEPAGEELRISGLDAEGVGEAALAAGVPLNELRVAEQDLESRYMELTAGKGR